MKQWEFPLHDGGGTAFAQTVVAEGADEESASGLGGQDNRRYARRGPGAPRAHNR
jgi:hypothetical protein